MADAIGSLGLDTKDFEKGIDRVSSKLDSLKKPIADVDKSVTGLGASLKGLASVFSVAAVIGFTKSIIGLGGALSDQASALNMTAESIQELNYAFGQSGASSDDVTAAMVKLNQSMQEARDNTGTARESFERLGITWDDLAKSSPDEILMKIANGSASATDKVAALDAVVDILGRTGKKMAAGLSEGADGIRKLREEASKLTNEEVKALDDVGDAWDRITTKAKVYGAQALLGLKRQILNGPDSFTANKKGAEDKKIADLFATSPLPGSKDYDDSPKAGTPKDPRIVAKELADEKARLNDEEDRQQAAAKQEAQETEARNKEINDEAEAARKEEEEDNAHILEQAREQNKLAAERNKLAQEYNAQNQRTIQDEQAQTKIADTKRSGDPYSGRMQAVKDASDKRREINSKYADQRRALGPLTPEQERKLRQQQTDEIQEADHAQQRAEDEQKARQAEMTPADRRAMRNAGRREDRLAKNEENREKDLDDRIKRGAKGAKGSELENRRHFNEFKDQIDKQEAQAKEDPSKNVGENVKSIKEGVDSLVKALSDENKK